MSQLLFASVPAFNDLADATVAANKCITDQAIQRISNNAKWGAVRCEQVFMGFYKHGDTIPLPVSPVDGYAYSNSGSPKEVVFLFELYSTRAPAASFQSGQSTSPAISNSQSGNIYWFTNDISTTGVVAISIGYTAASNTATHDGIVKVWALCQRNMTLGAIPDFLDIPLDVFAAGQPLKVGDTASKYGITDVNENAKFGAVRHEVIFQGFWASGYNVSTDGSHGTYPVSPVDGYVYSQAEIRYKATLYSNCPPAGGFINGQTTAPTLAGGTLTRRDSKGPLYWWESDIDDTVGLTYAQVSYYINKAAETIYGNGSGVGTGDGIFKVYAICQRSSSNALSSAAGAAGFGIGTTGGVGGIGGSTGGDTAVPDAPTVAVVTKQASLGSNKYNATIGIQTPGTPANWNSIFGLDIQISADASFVTFVTPDGTTGGLNGTATGRPWRTEFSPFYADQVDFGTNSPGTFYVRARMWNGFGAGAWAAVTLTSDVLDSLTQDTGLVPGQTPIVVLANGSNAVGGNEFNISWPVPATNTATFWGTQVFAHTSGTLPTATTFLTGTAGALSSGVAIMTDGTASFTPGALVGKDLVIFSPSRAGSPSFDYEGMIVLARITANTSTTITFNAFSQNLNRTVTGCKYYVVTAGGGNHFFDKLTYVSPWQLDPNITNPTVNSIGALRNLTVTASVNQLYFWVSMNNVFGQGPVAGSGVTATMLGIRSAEVLGTGAGTGAITEAKTNVTALGAITMSLGTVQTGLLQTAASGQRITLDGTNGIQAYDAANTLVTHLALATGYFATTFISDLSGPLSLAAHGLLQLSGGGVITIKPDAITRATWADTYFNFDNPVGIWNTAPASFLDIGNSTDQADTNGIAPFGTRLSVEESSTQTSGTKLTASVILVQKASNSGATQAAEATASAQHPSGTVASMSGLTGSARHNSANTVTTMRGGSYSTVIQNTGNGTHAVCVDTNPIGQTGGGSGVFTNGYGLRVGTFGAGFTNKFAVYCADTTAQLFIAGPSVRKTYASKAAFKSGAIPGEDAFFVDGGVINVGYYDGGNYFGVAMAVV